VSPRSRKSPEGPIAARAAARAVKLDRIDQQLLSLLQQNARSSNAELARRVGLSGPGVQKRLRKLEESGVILQHATKLDREALGLDLLCFVQVTLAHHQPEAVQGFRSALQRLPDVLECHHTTGEFDYLLKVVVSNHKELERFLVEQLTPVPGVDRIRTSIVLREVKSSTALPLARP
jgi:DNA-binding Lrp family transcriptional regulator